MVRWGEDDLARAMQGLRVEGRWGRGRPKLKWEQVIREHMIACGKPWLRIELGRQ